MEFLNLISQLLQKDASEQAFDESAERSADYAAYRSGQKDAVTYVVVGALLILTCLQVTMKVNEE